MAHPDTFAGAVIGRLRSTAAFTSLLAAGPDGIFAGLGAPNQAPPYVEVHELANTRQYRTTAGAVLQPRIQLTLCGATADQADRLLEQVEIALDPRTAAPLAFSQGRVQVAGAVFVENDVLLPRDELAPEGRRLFRRAVELSALVASPR